MTVRFSCRCPNADYLGFEATPEGIITTAVKAEELGFDAVFVNDHIIVDGLPRSAPWTNTYDPFVSLSFIAANTTRIDLGVSVLVVPYRNPIATAKMLATLDRMSNGRLIAGVGVGWNEAEFKALGVPFHERGARTTEYLQIWQACWAPGEVSFDGRFFRFSNMHVSPKPLRQPYPPIWVGGSSDAALWRAAAFAAVWQPTPTPVAELIERRTFLSRVCERIGRQRPENAHELPGRVQRHHRQYPALGRRTADRVWHVRRGCRRSVALPGSGWLGCFPDQLSRQSQPWAAPRLDGPLHAGREAAGDVTEISFDARMAAYGLRKTAVEMAKLEEPAMALEHAAAAVRSVERCFSASQ
jgi:probable F420-dependent oxidoreductase